MNLPDASTLDFPDGNGPCPSLQTLPKLKVIADNPKMQASCKTLGDILMEVKAGQGKSNVNVDSSFQCSQPLQASNIAAMKLGEFDVKKMEALIVDCTAVHHNMMSLLTIILLIMTLTAKRFVRALEENSTPPAALVKNLSDAMKVARDSSLSLPGSLQARAVKFTGP